MDNRLEKLSLLSEMMAYSKYDKDVKRMESDFLLGVAKQLDITRKDFEYLIKHPVADTFLKSHSQRIVQFQRLILLMDVDLNDKNGHNSSEVIKLYTFGLHMGLSHEAITKTLYLMESFPDKNVPTDVLIDIFKTQYN